MNFLTTKEAEQYVDENFDIVGVNFEGLDLEICKTIVEALNSVYTFFPEVIKAINVISTYEEINDHYNQITGLEGDHTAILERGGILSAISLNFAGQERPIYLSIAYPSSMKNKPFAEAMGKYLSADEDGPEKALKTGIYHECIHLMDALFKISDSEEFKAILRKHDYEQMVFDHLDGDYEEFLAALFANFFIMANTTEAVDDIFDLINKRYQEDVKEYNGKLSRSK